MNILIILAAGSGTRIKTQQKPKQFIEINNIPLLIHCIKNFQAMKLIDKYVVVVNKAWMIKTHKILNEFGIIENIDICEGGSYRNESLQNAVRHVKKNLNPNSDDNILTHDAARIFASKKSILESIKCLNEGFDAVNISIAAQDTFMITNERKEVINILQKENLYHSQTPQSFKWATIENLYLTSRFPKKIFQKCDATTLAFIHKLKIKIVLGNKENTKVTDDFDLSIMTNLIEKNIL